MWTDHPDKLVAVTVERRRSSEQTRQIGLLSNQLGNLGTPGDTGAMGEYGIMILLPGGGERSLYRVRDLQHLQTQASILLASILEFNSLQFSANLRFSAGSGL